MLIGFTLVNREVEKPLKKLTHDAIALSKGDAHKLPENNSGAWGGIARSINLAIERTERERVVADSLKTEYVTTCRSITSTTASLKVEKTPPPSQFKFSDSTPSDVSPPGFKKPNPRHVIDLRVPMPQKITALSKT